MTSDSNGAYDWFEDIYADGIAGGSKPPWSGMEASRWLTGWFEQNPLDATGKSALVIGSGLGDDAEWLASYGYQTTAFDVAPSAIKWTRQRFPETRVDYHVADLFAPPKAWLNSFDFVLESRTIQALPPEMNLQSIEAVANLVAPAGDLLVICLGKPKVIAIQGPPWPLIRETVDLFQQHNLTELSFETFNTDQHTPVQRWRIHYQREGSRD